MDLGHVWTDDSESKKFCGTFSKVARRRHFLKEMVSSFSSHRFFSGNQDAVMMKIEKRNHIKTVLGIQKIIFISSVQISENRFCLRSLIEHH